MDARVSLPAAVMPIHDPEGLVLLHLVRVLPLLEATFERVYASITPATAARQPALLRVLDEAPAFDLFRGASGAPVGAQFCALYGRAVARALPKQVLHLCFADRVAFALQESQRALFCADVRAVGPGDAPLLFQRSERAWRTHPRNYRRIERMATDVGEWLLGRRIDWAWCHLALRAEQLAAVLPNLRQQDLSLLCEILLALWGAGAQIATREVDWLSWEDPFITGRDALQLRVERENSVDETRKRLAYVLPKLALLVSARAGDEQRRASGAAP